LRLGFKDRLMDSQLFAQLAACIVCRLERISPSITGKTDANG
jgi:hypothetical protein